MPSSSDDLNEGADGRTASPMPPSRENERRQMTAALVRLQHHYERILNAVGEGIHVIDREGTIIFENPAAAAMLGYDVPELVGRPAHATMHHTRPDGSPYPVGECQIYATLHDGVARRIEDDAFWRKDGRSFPVDYTSTSIRNDADEIVGAVVAFRNSSERTRAQERLRQVVDASPTALVMVDGAGRITLMNAQAEHLFGYARAELVSQPIERLVPERYRATHAGHRATYLVHPDMRVMGAGRDLSGLRKDSTEIPVEIGLNPLVTDEGTFVLASIIDITERKRGEAALRAKNDELKSFAYTVSHDLKAPLRGITGYAQELERRHRAGLTERAQFCIAQIITASKNLDCLIEDLLKYSRLDAETSSLAEVKLPELVQSILRDRNHTLTEQGVEVTVNVPPVTLWTWERGLRQVLTNLIDNAIKYSRQSTPPRLTLTAWERPDGWRVAVADNGIGFDMKYHDRIFGLFNRLVRANEFEGTGAGLAIVKKLIEKLGGTIRAESTPGQGATFYVDLPHPVNHQPRLTHDSP